MVKLHFFKTPDTTYPPTQHRIPGTQP